MKTRINIEEAENGYTIEVWGANDSDDMYGDCTSLVAKTPEEVLELVTEYLKEKK